MNLNTINIHKLAQYKVLKAHLYKVIDEMACYLNTYTPEYGYQSPNTLFDFCTQTLFPAIDFNEKTEWDIFEKFWYSMSSFGDKEILNKSIALEEQFLPFFNRIYGYHHFMFCYYYALLEMNYHARQEDGHNFLQTQIFIIECINAYPLEKREQFHSILETLTQSLSHCKKEKVIQWIAYLKVIKVDIND